MAELHLPDNIKVHFAGAEVQNQYIAAKALGVNYHLYTAFPFVERMVFGKGKSPIMPLRWQKNPAFDIPQNVIRHNLHVIQDSGLFTLMFGSRKGTKDEALVNRWYDALVEYTLANAAGATCVEVDCQKILSPAKAWEFRERMRRDLPNNRIINVFHLEDGREGLDRMIEFSDYIAISVPELRVHHKKEYVPQLARYIKSRKPAIDIHLLGCTELALLHECRFCTSADSTTYVAGKRFGYIQGAHISRLKSEAVRQLVGGGIYDHVREYNSPMNTNFLLTNIERLKADYTKHAGNQDFVIYEKN